jgi:hypothetical protein
MVLGPPEDSVNVSTTRTQTSATPAAMMSVAPIVSTRLRRLHRERLTVPAIT